MRFFTRVQNNIWISSSITLLLLFAGSALIQWTIPGLGDSDSYYHIKMGWLVRHEGLTPSFPWLPLTILKPDAFYDHHMLYHVYLAVFAWGDPTVNGGRSLVTGAKWATVSLNALTFWAVWWLLYKQQIRWASGWTLGLFGLSYIFLFRLHMVRAQTASLLILVLILHLLLTQRYVWLIAAGAFYVWLYDAFPLLMLIAGIHFIALWWVERRWRWQILIYTSIGTALGLVINPYFPRNVVFTLRHILPKLTTPTTTLGPEWYPYDPFTLIQTSGIAFVVVLLATGAIWRKRHHLSTAMLSTWLLAVVFAVLAIRSKRFLEYSPAFGLIALAICSQPLIEHWYTNSQMRRRLQLIVIPLWLVAILSTLVQARQAMQALDQIHPADTNRDVSVWLRANAPANALVLNTSWHHFPFLFFYNTDQVYALGLDPTYMQLDSKQRYDTWVAIANGQIAQPAFIIREQFGATHVLVQTDQTAFLTNVKDPHLREVYRDKYAVVFEVR